MRRTKLCVAQFVNNVWIESYDPTIEDSYRKQFEVDVSQAFRYALSLLTTTGTPCHAGDLGYSRHRAVHGYEVLTFVFAQLWSEADQTIESYT